MPDTCPAIRLAFSARARLRNARCQGSTPPGVGAVYLCAWRYAKGNLVLREILRYERAFNGNPVLREGSSRESCATRGLLKAILCHERAFKGNTALRGSLQRQSCATRGLLQAILCYERAFKGNPVLREGL